MRNGFIKSNMDITRPAVRSSDWLGIRSNKIHSPPSVGVTQYDVNLIGNLLADEKHLSPSSVFQTDANDPPILMLLHGPTTVVRMEPALGFSKRGLTTNREY